MLKLKVVCAFLYFNFFMLVQFPSQIFITHSNGECIAAHRSFTVSWKFGITPITRERVNGNPTLIGGLCPSWHIVGVPGADKIVKRGGRCLIPVFALGRAQELLLILDEYWNQTIAIGKN
jgi:hypothetical protein